MTFAPKPPDSSPAETLRSRLRSEVGNIDVLETAISLLADACKPNRTVRIIGIECAKCDWKCPHHHDVLAAPDARTLQSALQFFIDNVEGRPGVAGVEEAGTVVKLVLVGVDDINEEDRIEAEEEV